MPPPPYLSEEEFILVDRLKGIFSFSRAIKEMKELWLVKIGWISASYAGCPRCLGQGPLDPCLAARPPRSDLGHQDLDKEMKTRWRGLKNSIKIWNDSSAAEEFERGLLHPQLARELYTLPSEVLLARAAKEMVLMALFDRVHDAGRLSMFMDYRISNLQQELDALKSRGGPEAVAKAEERASELEQELGKIKRELDEGLREGAD
ncbi:hypothetical protein GW17_00060468 [Ensete ventricosum]|nr:hypothetical protein GW17_00060468 [Ensete ventricosum]